MQRAVCHVRVGWHHCAPVVGLSSQCGTVGLTLPVVVFQGLDNVSSGALRPFTSDLNTPRIDSYRFSMANLEGKYSTYIFS